MAVAPGGMPAPRTCTLPFPNPTLIAVVFCRCWSNGCASSLLYEPPYTEPYVRWCGRTAEVTPPPTRSKRAAVDEATRNAKLQPDRRCDCKCSTGRRGKLRYRVRLNTKRIYLCPNESIAIRSTTSFDFA